MHGVFVLRHIDPCVPCSCTVHTRGQRVWDAHAHADESRYVSTVCVQEHIGAFAPVHVNMLAAFMLVQIRRFEDHYTVENCTLRDRVS